MRQHEGTTRRRTYGVTRTLAPGAAAIALVLALAIGCAAPPRASDAPNEQGDGPGRLAARPHAPTAALALAPGLHPLGLASPRDGYLYVPAGYRADRPAPLVLLLHGAGRRAPEGLSWMQPLADSAGLVLLAPDARDATWDFVTGPYGPDVAFIDRALAFTFQRVAIDPRRVAVAGFSDGASYALSLGITNADLFARIVAFSGCIVAPAREAGHPRIFLSHGTDDHVLPIDRCGRRLHDRLDAAGYDVSYHEFAGPHMVPPAIAAAAVAWLAAP